jgi:predicted DNA-binding protein YlxM (UPF0122 family)
MNERDRVRADHNQEDIRRLLDRPDDELLEVVPERHLKRMRRWLAGVSLADIGKDEGVSRQTVHQQIHRWAKHLALTA